MVKKKVRILKSKNVVETLKVTIRPSVVISEYFDSAQRLGDIVEELGYVACFTEVSWPRDRIVSLNDRYVSNTGREGRKIAEGGYFVQGKDYMIYSKEVYPKSEGYAGAITKLEKQITDFFEVPVYPIGGFCSNGGKWVERHIDLTMLTIPQRNLLIVDNRHYLQAKEEFEEIAGKQGVELVRGKYCQAYSLNCLVLDYLGDPVVVVNERAKHLQGLFNELKIDFIPITPDWGLEQLRGSIRCRTNTAINPSLFERLGLRETRLEKQIKAYVGAITNY